MNNEDRKIIAVDFDGTIVEDNWPHIGCIIPRVKKYLIKQKEENNAYIILWTCRCGRKLEEAVEFCDKADIPIDRVNSNAPWILEDYPFEPRKIHAVEYIDDNNTIVHEHHVDAIGMGGNRQKIDDSNHRKVSLCAIHHTEVHNESWEENPYVWVIEFEVSEIEK